MASSEASQDVFCEFYIATNPPLHPTGVERIIELVNNYRLQNHGVLEILYEPDTAWFKCIATEDCQDLVTKDILDLVRGMTNGIECVRGQVENEPIRTILGNPVDIDVHNKEVEILPWSEYNDSKMCDDKGYERFQYPEVMKQSEYKTVWPGLESHSIPSLESLLKIATSVWRVPEAPDTISKFEDYVDCRVLTSFNKKNVYIGATEDKSRVDLACEKLDTMLSACAVIQNTGSWSSIIATSNAEQPELIFRSTSHLGLARQTFLFPDQASRGGYTIVLGGVAVRVASEEEWNKNYLPRQDMLMAIGIFSVFADFSFPPRKATPAKPVTDLQSKWATDATAVHMERRTDAASKPKPTDLSSKGLPGSSSRPQPKPDKFKLLREGKLRTSTSLRTHMPDLEVSNNRIVDWVQHVAGEDLMSFDEPTSTGILIDLSNDSDGAAEAQVPQASHSLKSKKDKKDHGDLLGDELAQPAFSSSEWGILPVSNASVPEESDLMTFEIAGDPPKSFHKTMNQKASRGSGGMNRLNGTQRKASLEKSPGGQRPQPQDRSSGPAYVASSKVVKRETYAGTVGKPPTSSSTNPKQQVNQGNPPKSSSPKPASPKPAPPTQRPAATQAQTENEKPSTNSLNKNSALLKKTEEAVCKLAELLQLTSGDVKLEIQFGRILLARRPQNEISINGLTPCWDLKRLQEDINQYMKRDIHFYGILSSNAADGDKIAQVRAWGEPGWEFHAACTVYELTCQFSRSVLERRFQISIDSKNFTFQLRGLEQEAGCVHIHCPASALDIKARISSAARSGWPSMCDEFAERLVNSLSVETDAAGEVLLRFEEDKSTNVNVLSIRVKHTARYQSKARASSSSILEIRLIRPLRISPIHETKDAYTLEGKSHFTAENRGLSQPGHLDEWIEASILSTRAEELFEENSGLKFAERTGWTCNGLEEDGVFRDLCRPALSMVTLMDHIGVSNDNKQGPGAHGSITVQKDGGKGYEFW